MSEKNNRYKGIAGTIGFHLLALLALLYFALSTPLPLPGEEGVEVNLGSSDQGMGQVQEQSPPPVQQPPPSLPPPQSDPEPEPEEDIITQDVEEAPAIEEEKTEEKEEEKQEEEVVKPEETPIEEVVQEAVEEPEPQPEPPKVNERALYKGKSETEGDGSNQGITGQAGDQGKPDGTIDSGNYDGTGKGDEGIKFDLGGRGARNLIKPDYPSQELGVIVVTIRVDKNGNVKSAIAGARGTTISDARLHKLVVDAALRSKFEPDPNASDVTHQQGTITYKIVR
ncbi:MAG: hypothetical protein ABFS05_07030 [Bacteroidota bacterium]